MNNTVLNIALMQSPILWEDINTNLLTLRQELIKLPNSVDLVVLPELFSTGFTNNTSLAEPFSESKTLKTLQAVSNEQDIAICGSLMLEVDGDYFNRFVFISPKASIEFYDKHRLFTMGDEHKFYTSGKTQKIIHFKGWKLFSTICYDIRFPVWCRNTANYDILLNVANWPAPRSEVWNTLLKARAIENQCFVLALNRTGADGNNIKYNGGSCLINAKGQIAQKMDDNSGVEIVTLNKQELIDFRKAFPVLEDRDQFNLNY